jgi:pimeloyl-ACP methyl ester carboxylesterase
MRQVAAVDGFRLAYDRAGRGPAAVLLHGWPGDRADYEEVAPLVAAAAEVITPDLRGFGESDMHQADPADALTCSTSGSTGPGRISTCPPGTSSIW